MAVLWVQVGMGFCSVNSFDQKVRKQPSSLQKFLGGRKSVVPDCSSQTPALRNSVSTLLLSLFQAKLYHRLLCLQDPSTLTMLPRCGCWWAVGHCLSEGQCFSSVGKHSHWARWVKMPTIVPGKLVFKRGHCFYFPHVSSPPPL